MEVVRKAIAPLILMLSRDVKGTKMTCYSFRNSKRINKENVRPRLNGAGNLVSADADRSGELSTRVSANKVSQAIVLRVRTSKEKNNHQCLRVESGMICKNTGLQDWMGCS